MDENNCEVRMSHYGNYDRGRRGCTVDHETVALGRRLMAVPGYEPEAGMVAIGSECVSAVARGFVYFAEGWRRSLDGFVPDLSHGATQGVVLDQLREMYKEPRLCLVYVLESETSREGWQVHLVSGNPVGGGTTRERALLNAVENWGYGVAYERKYGAGQAACVDALNTEPDGGVQ